MNKRPEKAWAAQRRLTPAAKAAFIAALREEASLAEAARSAGFCLQTFYRARQADPHFAADWEAAYVATAGPRVVAPGNRRRVQRRKVRQLPFSAERKAIFLAHFAGTCNAAEAAAVAGVSETTVYRHRIKDAAFAEQFGPILEQGYVRLEAAMLLLRIEAQQLIREGRLSTGEVTAEFERGMKLLIRWDRRCGQIGPRQVAHDRRPAVTIEEVATALHERLQHLDIPILQLPRPDGEEPAA